MRYPAYPDYVQTRWGSESIIPITWEARRLKFAVSLRNEKIDAEASNLEYIGLEHIESWTGKRIEDETANSEGIATQFAKNDVLFGKLRPYLAKVYLAEKEGMATTEVLVMMTGETLVPSFLKYVLLSDKFIDSVSGTTYGVKMPRANWEMIGALPIFLPPTTEQVHIAAFLDWKTGQIDALIAKKQALIEKLKEKRLAVITQAVTKGLDPTTPMKDSGISWFGQVPKHWEVMELRRRWTIQDCKHKTVSFVADGIPLASIKEVHDFEVNLINANQTTEEEYLELIEGGRKPEIGDIIYSRNASVGDAAIVTTAMRFSMGQDVCLLRSPNAFPRFSAYLLRSKPLREQTEALMIGSTFRRINVGQIKTLWATVPPFEEQREIANFLDKALNKHDSMVSKVEQAVVRLTEYRTALITAATTGQIDVRNVVIPAHA